MAWIAEGRVFGWTQLRLPMHWLFKYLHKLTKYLASGENIESKYRIWSDGRACYAGLTLWNSLKKNFICSEEK